MRSVQFVLLGVFLLSAIQFISADEVKEVKDNFELLMVAEFFRHGARGPEDFAASNWSYGGELTETGLRQHYIAGKELRHRYKDFLPDKYNYTLIHSQSTNINRTLMSAMAHTLGLFDLDTGPKMPKDYQHERAVPPFPLTSDPTKIGEFAIPNGYQPVPINTVDKKDDYVMYSEGACKKLHSHQDVFTQTDWWKNAEGFFKPNYEKWAKTFGRDKPLDLEASSLLYDNFYADWFQGNKTPITIENEMVANLSMAHQFLLGYSEYPDQKAVNLLLQPTLEKLFEIIDHRTKPNGSNMKWFTFSGHDDNIMLLQMAFNLTSLECMVKKMSTGWDEKLHPCLVVPPYATLILFETYKHKKTGEIYLKFITEDKDNYPWCPESAKDPEYPNYCKYTPLKEHVKKNLFVDNWKEACGIVVKPTPPKPEVQESNMFLTLFIGFCCLILVLAFGVGFMRKKLMLSAESSGSGHSDNTYVEVT